MEAASTLLFVIRDGLAVDANAASIRQLLRQSLSYSLVVGSLASAALTAFSAAPFSLLVNAIFWGAGGGGAPLPGR